MPTHFRGMFRLKPQSNDSPIEEIEPVSQVAEQTVGDHFEEHLEGEQAREEQIRIFQDCRENLWLE